MNAQSAANRGGPALLWLVLAGVLCIYACAPSPLAAEGDSASCDERPPVRFWTWRLPPNGHPMWQDPCFGLYIRVDVRNVNAMRPPGYGPYAWSQGAEALSQCITDWYEFALAQGYTGPVALHLAGWGQPDAPNCTLFMHEDDRFSTDPQTGWPAQAVDAQGRQKNVYIAHGCTEAAAWTARFIPALQQRIASRNYPQPIRFELAYLMMDLEDDLSESFAVRGGGSDRLNVRGNWTPAMADERFEREVVLDGRTYAQLWRAGGSIAHDDEHFSWQQVNWAFTNWLSGIYERIEDAAMNRTLYKPFRAAFAGVRCGNFGHALSSGAQVTRSNPEAPVNPILGSALRDSTLLAVNGQVWRRPVIEQLHADYANPVFYAPNMEQAYELWPRELVRCGLPADRVAAMSRAELYRLLTALNIVRSAEAARAADKPVIPWLQTPHTQVGQSMIGADDFLWTVRQCRRAGMRDLQLFMSGDYDKPPDGRHWDDLLMLMRQAAAETIEPVEDLPVILREAPLGQGGQLND